MFAASQWMVTAPRQKYLELARMCEDGTERWEEEDECGNKLSQALGFANYYSAGCLNGDILFVKMERKCRK